MTTLQGANSIPADAQALLRECKRLIQTFLPDATLMLYGSLARGTAGPESDWDIIVLTGKPLTSADEDRVSDALYGLELAHGAVISAIFYARDEWDDPLHRAMPLHREVERDGVVL